MQITLGEKIVVELERSAAEPSAADT